MAAAAERAGERTACWYVYIVRCADGTLYTGVATDVDRRLAEHRAGAPRGARYLRGRAPLELVFAHRVGSRAAAQRVEHSIKSLPRRRKEALVSGASSIAALAIEIGGDPP